MSEDTTKYVYQLPPAPEFYPHERLDAIYAAKRKAHTDSCILKTKKPRKKKVKPAEVDALKHRVESVEGSEVVETIITSSGEQPIAPRPEELPEGKTPSFNGA